MVTGKVEATTLDIIKHTGFAMVDIISTARLTPTLATVSALQTTHLYSNTYQLATCPPEQEANSPTDHPAVAQPEHMAVPRESFPVSTTGKAITLPASGLMRITRYACTAR
jgi:hypothetical protein